MTAAGPVPPPVRRPAARNLGWRAGRPDTGHPPFVEPVHDLVQPGDRAVDERCPGRADHPDLGAHPALVVHPGQPVPGGRSQRVRRGEAGQAVEAGLRIPVAHPGSVLAGLALVGGGRPAEGPRGARHRDELGQVAGQRVPHQVAWPAQADQRFRRFPRRGAHRVPRQDQPDSAWDAALQAAAIGGCQDSLCPRHPRVSHDAPSSGLDHFAAVPLPEYVRPAH